MKYALIARNVTSETGIARYCRVLEVSRSGYYEWSRRGPTERARRRQALDERVKAIHESSRKAYGSPRVSAVLRAEGCKHSRTTVARSMRRQGLKSTYHRRFRPQTTDSTRTKAPAPNVLEQRFTASAPNEKWVSDITYIPTAVGWAYLCVILDLLSRKVVGHAMSNRINAALVVSAFAMAVARRGKPKELLFHSDRGSQYDAAEFRAFSALPGLGRSMSRVGNCYDNAVCESFFKTLKVELVFQTSFESHPQAAREIARWIESFYNSKRIHSSLNFLSPAAFELRHPATLKEAA